MTVRADLHGLSEKKNPFFYFVSFTLFLPTLLKRMCFNFGSSVLQKKINTKSEPFLLFLNIQILMWMFWISYIETYVYLYNWSTDDQLTLFSIKIITYKVKFSVQCWMSFIPLYCIIWKKKKSFVGMVNLFSAPFPNWHCQESV